VLKPRQALLYGLALSIAGALYLYSQRVRCSSVGRGHLLGYLLATHR